MKVSSIVRLLVLLGLAAIALLGIASSFSVGNEMGVALWFGCFLVCFLIEGIGITNDKLTDANKHLSLIASLLRQGSKTSGPPPRSAPPDVPFVR